MPKRTDIKSILILGAGPIVIGQACEFDYSGAQACKALREEGYRVILVNSNPATIMTDPEMADATYIEPIHWEVVRKIIEKERPDAVLPTMGGQTALNCALELERQGVLAEFGVTMIGATADAIDKAEDRRRFDVAMKKIGLDTARSGIAHTMEEALAVAADVGYPCIIRPSFTMGGTGGGIAYNREEFEEICARGLDLSPTNELLIDESLIGWKEYEMEVVRDKNDNCIIVCSIENFDAMGIHTGDSITVAPAQTLTDKEYQVMRNASMAVLREIGVETGGSNVQFSVNPKDGRLIVIEMNPRVSRSSALASKATGFPIAKVAAKLAVGYTLDELMNDITGGRTPASFEPSIDYVVTKIPRFNFEKFVGANDRLTTQMKSVGEVMAIGRTQQESLQKALRGLEVGATGFDPKVSLDDPEALTKIRRELKDAGAERIWYIADAFRAGLSVDGVFNLTNIDRWFLVQIEELVRLEEKVADLGITGLTPDFLRQLKRKGFADARLAKLAGVREGEIRKLRDQYNLHPVYKRVDTCAAEFATDTAYMYSTYEDECEANPSVDRDKIMVLGGGPNRIGQGIEFDYCCVHASLALREDGYETIMVNCNPETVSTDYDTSDKLYFEPLTFEDVMDIVDVEDPDGVVVTLGGQTPLKLARALQEAGVPIMGTSPEAIDLAEDRDRFSQVLDELKIIYPAAGEASTLEEAHRVAEHISFPLLVRPSYVLGGRGMEIAYDPSHLRTFMAEATRISPDHPVYLDRFLEGAIECDVDALCDGEQVYVGGVLEHIEEAGIHSGDSATCIPPFSFSDRLVGELRDITRRLALRLGVRGLLNVQYAIKGETIYVIEANPRASRTVPFVSKSTGVPLAKCAALIMSGRSIESLGLPADDRRMDYFCVKEAVMPWGRFPGANVVLGPEMKSTGEVMGIASTYPEAYAKTQLAVSYELPKEGTVFISVCDRDKRHILPIARTIQRLGFRIVSTEGTARTLRGGNVRCEVVRKISEPHPNVGDMISNGEIVLIVNTPYGSETRGDGYFMRTEAVKHGVTCVTALSGASAFTAALEALDENPYGLPVIALQDLPQYEVK